MKKYIYLLFLLNPVASFAQERGFRSMNDMSADEPRYSFGPTKHRTASIRDIFIGSRSLIVQLLNSNLIDEFQLCVHPVIEGKGLPLFDQIKERAIFKLSKTKSLKSGATVLYYEPKTADTINC